MASFEFKIIPQNVEKIQTRNRLIGTEIPAPGTIKILRDLELFESRSMHGQLPLVWEKAIGSSVYDIAGNKWIDFTSGIFVTNVGHSNPAVSNAIKKSINQNLYSCYAYPNKIRAQYHKALIEFAGPPFEKAFLLSAGTEATEAAFKLMRMHGQKSSNSKKAIICIENNWHGRTLGAQSMSSNKMQKAWIGNVDPDIYHIPFPYPWVTSEDEGRDFFDLGLKQLEEKGINFSRDVSGFMVETFQGWGAVFYPKSFIQRLVKFAAEHGALVCFDEMQAGFGRTGKKFGFQHYEVFPDLIACGKGMGGGVPLSGVLGRGSIMDLPEVGNMSSTHSANPLVCHAGVEVLNEITRVLPEIEEKSKIFKSKLLDLMSKVPDRISHILGKGMIFAVLFRNPYTGETDSEFASMLSEKCMQKGLLVVHTGRESIKLGPPLTIEIDALIEGLDVLKEAVLEINDAS